MKMLSIFDGHNDTLLHLSYQDRRGGRSFFERSDWGHIDLPRAREGGFAGGFFAVYVRADSAEAGQHEPTIIKEADCCATEGGFETPYAPAIDPVYAQRTAIAVTAALFRLEEEGNGQVKVVRTADELVMCLHEGVLAAVLHFEGAEAIDPKLDALEVFYRAGAAFAGASVESPQCVRVWCALQVSAFA